MRTVSLRGDVGVISGHEAPVLSVSLSPVSHHLLSASCDGTVKLWTLNTKACLNTYNILQKCSDVRSVWVGEVPLGQAIPDFIWRLLYNKFYLLTFFDRTSINSHTGLGFEVWGCCCWIIRTHTYCKLSHKFLMMPFLVTILCCLQ